MPAYRDLLFSMGSMTIARPSNQPTGPVMVINSAYRNHFEILSTTLPRVSVKLNNPDMTSHTQVFMWFMLTGSAPPQDVPLIVSGEPSLLLATRCWAMKPQNIAQVIEIDPNERQGLHILEVADAQAK